MTPNQPRRIIWAGIPAKFRDWHEDVIDPWLEGLREPGASPVLTIQAGTTDVVTLVAEQRHVGEGDVVLLIRAAGPHAAELFARWSAAHAVDREGRAVQDP